MRVCLLFAPLLVVACGCENEPKSDEVIPIADVPVKILNVAKKELPGYTFDTAFKMKIEGKDAYEVRGKNSRGKTREVEIAVDGKVLRVE
jgi:hypothetical protein